MRPRVLFLAALAASSLTACDTTPATAAALRTVYGAPVELGGGTVRAYATLDAAGAPLALGVSIPDSVVRSLPVDMRMIEIPLPREAAGTGFDHVGFDWNPTGHDPMMYHAPHFDVHFYQITSAERRAILGGAEPTPLPAANVPTDYVSAGESVPEMGVHWVDTKSPELNGAPFTTTLIYGSYKGRQIFVEPMLTVAYLQSLRGKPAFTAPVKQPAAVQRAGVVPLEYGARYDAASGSYRVELTNLARRTPPNA